MSVLITPYGEEKNVTPKDGVAFSVTELQDLVDGYIGVETTERGMLVYDENGTEDDKLFNPYATKLVQDFDPNFDELISGNVVICPREMIKV